MNALSIISPYKLEGVGVFDDAAVALIRSGISDLLLLGEINDLQTARALVTTFSGEN